MRQSFLIAICLAGLVTAAARTELPAVTEAPGASGNLSCSLSVTGPSPQDRSIFAEMTLHNGLAGPVQVLRYFTPFEGILGEIFIVRWQGEPVPYEGPMVKRVAPGSGDWLLLEPGRELSARVNLASAWNLTRPGDYQVQLRNGISYRLPGEPESRQLDAASCGVVAFTL